MGFRFQRRIRIAPGVSINLCKTGVAFAAILGVVSFLAYQMAKVGRFSSNSVIVVMVVSGVLAAVFALLAFVAYCFSSDSSGSDGAVDGGGRYDSYVVELANASLDFYKFLQELNRSARCLNLLNSLPGMEAFSDEDNCFTINIRLAAIVYCDLRDCYRELGNDPENLGGLCGIGYAMIVVLLLSKNFDITKFFDRTIAKELLKTVGEANRTSVIELNIEGHDDEFRFSFLLGTLNGQHEWVQRYSTLMYRWASLLAKADGTVTADESATLAAIMHMSQSRPDGNVKVTGAGNAQPIEDESEGDNTEPPVVDEPESLNDAMESLDALIGLEPVKKDVRMLANFIKIQRRRRESGLKEAPISYHCVFTGNPGTGKTTVARILADIYRMMGVVKKGHLVETDRSGLIAEYVGQTAVKTNKIIDSALDGVLFIDEAYTLVQGGERDYGGEAIATLLKRMEDDRDRLVVILAGYTDEMKRFIDSNPGLQSRFNRYIQFPDYTAEELAKIFLLTAEKSQYVCNDDVKASLVDIMEAAVRTKDRNFGNGRFVRNLFERSIQRQAVRLSTVGSISNKMLAELTLHDLGYSYE